MLKVDFIMKHKEMVSHSMTVASTSTRFEWLFLLNKCLSGLKGLVADQLFGGSNPSLFSNKVYVKQLFPLSVSCGLNKAVRLKATQFNRRASIEVYCKPLGTR